MQTRDVSGPVKHSAMTRCPLVVRHYITHISLCFQGDVKGYLRSCRASETMTPEPLVLQRMACDIASGLLHMHKHDFTHR